MVRNVLSCDVKPHHYSVDIVPDFDAFTFQGKMTVSLECKEKNVRSVTCNALELTIDDAYVGEMKAEVSFDEQKQHVTFLFDECLEEQFELNVSFTGIMNDKLQGFYRSSYVDPNGNKKWLGCTQFEDTDARRCFPCWDEPALKATFDVSLTVPSNMIALGNMPIVEEKESDGVKFVRFDRTPMMSTYLVAFVVGELECFEVEGSSIRVYAPIGKKKSCGFAHEVASRAWPFYEKFFDIPYPLPKCDLVAIPDFAAGAMENWGLITFRETALLIDVAGASVASRMRVALVVCHEISHSWFGNLVTMEWWNGLWLNEAFATYFEYLAVADLFPKWNVWELFVATEFKSAMDLDALKSTHPIDVEINDAAEVKEIFDVISYSKGCAVVRMLASFVGYDAFQNGLSNYLKSKQYSNATNGDLWNALSESSGKNVSEMMDAWTRSPGYPYITATRSSSSDVVLELEQNRFTTSIGDVSDTIWHIPISYVSSQSQDVGYQLLTEKKSQLTLPKNFDWLKLNSGQIGLLRIKYPDDMLESFKKPILEQDPLLLPVDRAAIISDSVALSRIGRVSCDVILSLLESFVSETKYSVWMDLSSQLGSIGEVLVSGTKSENLFRKFITNLCTRAVERMGWNSSGVDDEDMVRAVVLSLSCRWASGEDDAVVQEALRRFKIFVDSNWADAKAIPPDLRFCVYSVAVRFGGDSPFDSLLEFLKKTDYQEEKIRCLRALGETRNPEHVKYLLSIALNEDVIRSQDIFYVLDSLSMHSRDLCFEWMGANWNELVRRYGESAFILGRIVMKIVGGYRTKEKMQLAQEFFDNHALTTLRRTFSQSLEYIEGNIRWYEVEKENVWKWLSERY